MIILKQVFAVYIFQHHFNNSELPWSGLALRILFQIITPWYLILNADELYFTYKWLEILVSR